LKPTIFFLPVNARAVFRAISFASVPPVVRAMVLRAFGSADVNALVYLICVSSPDQRIV